MILPLNGRGTQLGDLCEVWRYDLVWIMQVTFLPYGIMGEWIRDLEFYKKVKKLFMGQGQLVVMSMIDIVEWCTSEMLSIL